jgi:crotonobetainyl-CoA:carnitine CoA-transferase CaiB-like acyl-CoA transferase
VISAWTGRLGTYDAARRLQEAGIPAAPVCSGAEVGADPGLVATGMIRELDHPEAGRHAYPGLAYRLSRTPGGVAAPAPCFGEHNDAVLHGILALPEERVTELREAGAVTDRPAAVQPGRGRAPTMPAGTSRRGTR